MEKRGVVLLVFILIILVINGVLGQEINLTYPENTEVGQEFDVNIEVIDFSEDIYDVKFEILNGSRSIAQRLWNEEWRSTHYWIEDCINVSENFERDFRLKISENYNGLAEIVVKF